MPAAKVGCGTSWHQEGGDWWGQVTGWTLFTLGQWSHGQKKLVATWGKQRASGFGFHLSFGDTGDTPTFNSPPGTPLCPKITFQGGSPAATGGGWWLLQAMSNVDGPEHPEGQEMLRI